MSGPGPWERQVLESIEIGLGDSDPELALLLTMFGRLASDEEMPARERIRTSLRHPPRRRRRRRPGRARRPGSVTLVWLAVSVTLIAVAVVLSRGGGSGCAVAWATGCTG
jgi:hypothetical protein